MVCQKVWEKARRIMKGRRINDEERLLWVLNDPVLYGLWKAYPQNIHRFISREKKLIDVHIRAMLGM